MSVVQTPTTMFGDFLSTMPKAFAEKYLLRQAEREKVFSEESKKVREKYQGYDLSDYEVEKILQAEKENKICESCSGLPCKKKSNPNFQQVIKPNEVLGKIGIAVKYCKYALAEQRLRENKKKFKKSKIPARYIGKTFSDYEVDNANRQAVELAKKFVKNPEKSMLFYGVPGSGKTFLSAIIAQEFLKQGNSVIFGDVPSLLEDLQSSYGEKNSGSLEEKMNLLAKADLIVLDDIGTEKPTEWAVTRLYLIINERYNAEKPLIVTSNYRGEELAERLNNPRDAKTSGVTGSRIVSRLRGICEFVRFGEKDRRLGK